MRQGFLRVSLRYTRSQSQVTRSRRCKNYGPKGGYIALGVAVDRQSQRRACRLEIESISTQPGAPPEYEENGKVSEMCDVDGLGDGKCEEQGVDCRFFEGL